VLEVLIVKLQGDLPDRCDQVKTPRKGVAVPRECENLGDCSRYTNHFNHLVPERVDYGTPRN